jgi:hypothetical protein
MASFNPPPHDPGPAFPPEAQAEIDASVRRFEEQWGLLLSFAKSNGHIENYRKEVTTLGRRLYNLGWEIGGHDGSGV